MVAFRSPKPSVRVRIFLLLQEIEVWCNGSTLDFGSNSSGSNPDTSTEQCRVGRVVHPSVCKTDYIGSNPVPDSKPWSISPVRKWKRGTALFPTRVKMPL